MKTKCQHNSLETHSHIYSENEVGIYVICKDCRQEFNHMYQGEDAKILIQHIKNIPFRYSK